MVVETQKGLKAIIERVNIEALWDMRMPAYKVIDYFACVDLVSRAGYHKMVDGACIVSVIYDECLNWKRTNRSLDKIPGVTTTKLSKKVDATLRSLPASYEIILPLPDSKRDHSSKISKDIELLRFDDERVQAYDWHSRGLSSDDMTEMLFAVDRGETSTGYYGGQNALLIKDYGFVDGTLNERLLQYDPLYLFKIYMAASIIWGSLQKNPKSSPAALSFPPYKYFIYKSNGKEYIKGASHTSEDYRMIDAYIFTEEHELVAHTNQLFADLITKQSKPAVAKLQNSIQKSLYWFYEAQKSTYSHLRVVYLCTALDAFFDQHDSDLQKKQIIALEASETIEQQELVLQEMHKLQLRRNSIVHGEAAITYTLQSSRATKEADQALTAGGEIFLTKFIGKKMDRFFKSLNS
jgi:hypothetical protein